jgi:acetyltransferase
LPAVTPRVIVDGERTIARMLTARGEMMSKPHSTSTRGKPAGPGTGQPALDPVSDVTRSGRRALRAFFAPRSVAVIGATDTPGSVGRTVLWNVISNPFGGTVFPVNPARPAVLGIKAYADVGAVPEKVDLAVIVTPAATVPGVIAECVKAGVHAAIVISAGFKETGPAGEALERRIVEAARAGPLRIIGPNCLGVMSPPTGLNATFASGMATPGTVAFISQSGALCTSVLDWSLREHVGFSAFVSIGSMLDVSWGDLIFYLADDPRTQSIIIYMETIGDARAFLSAAREVALVKPIIVLKPGRTEAAARAAASHTGALAGSDDVLDAAFRRSGVLRVNSIAELFYMAETLSKQPRPRGPRLTILTNAGGPAVIATDALLTHGGRLAELGEPTLAALDAVLPAAWSHANPIDILGDADPARYSRAVEIAATDPGSDGLLVILTPQGMTDPTQTAEELRPHAHIPGKPVLASWMGGAETAAGEAILNRLGIPTFAYPDTAARVFTYMWRYTDNLRSLYETPALPEDGGEGAPDAAQAGEILTAARRAGRTLLTEAESKALLAAYRIPTVDTRVARSEAEAVRTAEAMGFPVAVKLHSETITHKTEVGGVRLDVGDGAAVRAAFREIAAAVAARATAGDFLGVTVQPMVRRDGYELIIGASIDAQFGPIILFGAGGQLVEVFGDRALGLPPLNTTLARRLMEQTQIFTALGGVRGRPPVDLPRLEQLLVRFSQLVLDQPWIREIDINPLLASPEGLVALDARVVLHGAAMREEDLPRPAIRPYPRQYVKAVRLRDGSAVTVRPIRPEDEPLLVAFHGAVSERSVYLRYLHPIGLSQRVAHERLSRICFPDYDREMVLVAEGGAAAAPEIVGVGRLSRLRWTDSAEFSVLIADRWQRRGLGTVLVTELLDVGRREGLGRIVGYISAENPDMLRVSRHAGFSSRRDPDDPAIVEVWIDLPAGESPEPTRGMGAPRRQRSGRRSGR